MNALLPLKLFACSLAVSAVLLTGSLASAAEPVKIDPLDWPHWRGPEMNGISREKGLVSSWSPDGENLIWKNPDLATRSTPIVMRGKLYTICRHLPETEQEGEKVVCADAETGKILWENAFNVFLSDAPAERVGWSSVVGDPETGNVFALGICGVFLAIDGETGKTLWEHSMSEEYGLLSTYGGRTNFPTVFEDLVIISGVMTGWGDYAVPAHRFVAFDKKSGQAVWVCSTRLRPTDTTYSTPILTVFNGQAAMVFGAGDGSIYAIQPRTGKILWKYEASIRGINQTPVINGTTVYCGFSEEDATDPSQQGAVFALDGTGSGNITKTDKQLWKTPGIGAGRSAPLFLNDRLYAATENARLYVMDAKTGKELGKQNLGTIMFGSMVYGDGKIYAGESTGRWYVLEPTDKGVKIIHRLRLNEEEILGSPIISHGKIYLPTWNAMYCIGNKDVVPTADARPPAPKETPTADDTEPAQLQLVPVESLLKPGQKQQLHARLYNKLGRYLKTVPAQYEVQGPGTVDDKGVFTSPANAGHSGVIVTAKVGELTGTARVRIIPPLPWSFDFADKKVPPTWIGAAYRHQIREVDGDAMLVKVSTIPLGTRSQSWMGPINLHDYTVQADVKGASNEGKMPDIGLINQRYTLDLMGLKQLQIRSWTARLELRFAKTVPFEWNADTWYTMKFQGETKDGKVTLRGKVWPRGESEPEAWSIEATDETPNLKGSPGMFGQASSAEFFIDNVKVMANAD